MPNPFVDEPDPLLPPLQPNEIERTEVDDAVALAKQLVPLLAAQRDEAERNARITPAASVGPAQRAVLFAEHFRPLFADVGRRLAGLPPLHPLF